MNYTVSCPRCKRLFSVPRGTPAGAVGNCPNADCRQRIKFGPTGATIQQSSDELKYVDYPDDAATRSGKAVSRDDDDPPSNAPTQAAHKLGSSGKAPLATSLPKDDDAVLDKHGSMLGSTVMEAINDAEPKAGSVEGGSPLHLQGDNIALRRLRPADGVVIARWLKDAELTRIPTPGAEALAAFGHSPDTFKPAPDSAVFAVARAGGDVLLGLIGLFQIDFRNRHARLELIIGDDSVRGKGLRTEACSLALRYAFEEMNLQRVYVQLYQHDPRGRGVYDRGGFQEEGRLRSAYFCEGRYWDITLMSVLADEWRKAQPRTN